MRRGTWIRTALIDASQFRWTVSVLSALRLWILLGLFAQHERITLVAGTALTAWLMTTTHTKSIHSTCVLLADWTANAIQAIAGFVIRTILVVLAMASDASDEGTALGAFGTAADSLVVLWQAFGAAAATHLAVGARIDAVLIKAGLVIGTVSIYLAFGCENDMNH